jgi:hypothetical protein
MRLLGFLLLALTAGASLAACTSDEPGYPRYGLSDEPDTYAHENNHAHGSSYHQNLQPDTYAHPGDDGFYQHCYADGHCERVN